MVAGFRDSFHFAKQEHEITKYTPISNRHIHDGPYDCDHWERPTHSVYSQQCENLKIVLSCADQRGATRCLEFVCTHSMAPSRYQVANPDPYLTMNETFMEVCNPPFSAPITNIKLSKFDLRQRH